MAVTDCTITKNSTGPMFFVCNTTTVIELDGATLNNNSDTLLWATTAAAGSAVDSNVNPDWGNLGGTAAFTATNQTLEGDIDLEESGSSIELELINSSFSGAINSGNTGTADLILDADSTWEVTGDSYLSSLTNHGTITGTGTVYVNGVAYSYLAHLPGFRLHFHGGMSRRLCRNYGLREYPEDILCEALRVLSDTT